MLLRMSVGYDATRCDHIIGKLISVEKQTDNSGVGTRQRECGGSNSPLSSAVVVVVVYGGLASALHAQI